MLSICKIYFFFQAEDGIRDGHVTGVQTCALPICGVGEFRSPPPSFLYSLALGAPGLANVEIGRASCRERVSNSVVAVGLKKEMSGSTISLFFFVFQRCTHPVLSRMSFDEF